MPPCLPWQDCIWTPFCTEKGAGSLCSLISQVSRNRGDSMSELESKHNHSIIVLLNKTFSWAFISATTEWVTFYFYHTLFLLENLTSFNLESILWLYFWIVLKFLQASFVFKSWKTGHVYFGEWVLLVLIASFMVDDFDMLI